MEQIRGRQNRPISDDLERITISAFDSPDRYSGKVDTTFLDNGEGIGITDGQDGNSYLKKRIDGDEILTISINETDKYNSAIGAVITLDKIDSIYHHHDRNSIKVIAFLDGEIVWEDVFTVMNRKEQITITPDTRFDTLGIMAGDDNTKFTFREVEFDAVKTFIPVENSLKLSHNGNDLTVFRNNVEVESSADNQPLEKLVITTINNHNNSQVKVTDHGIGIGHAHRHHSSLNKFLDGEEILRVDLQAK